MKKLFFIFTAAVLTAACGRNGGKTDSQHGRFTIETVNKITPVKNQGDNSLCWLYAMLATIESDRLMMGDSVNLSPHYIARFMLADQMVSRYTSRQPDALTLSAMAPLTLQLMELHGVMPFDSYRSECNYTVLAHRLDRVERLAVNRRAGIARLCQTAQSIMDDAIGPLPFNVFMYGAEYTPREFAHSVCMPGEYQAMTSFTHLPFYTDVRLDVPDNRSGCRFINLPIDSLMNRITAALKSGRSVCWEGDISEPGFSFGEGVAVLDDYHGDLSQEARQRMFERFKTTDDHCMELIGLAHDAQGRRYFVCKNSWGTDNPYRGLMFMSADYARMKTVAVVMKVKD